MVVANGRPCHVFRPSVEEFSRPFPEYVRGVMADHPDIAMFKVVPPEGWQPSETKAFPDLADISISCPIRQHAFGKAGAYRCLLVEQKGMNAADFEKVCIREASHQPPKVGRRDDDLCERAFWSSVTIRPPLYGADTPQSFFDKELPFGWNLRDLGCLLKQYPVPNIPGVTFPMTYFGMWKSFFAWHLEDMDLFSVNYLHWGAPKVWYCVPPGDKKKFQQMAQSLFPDMHHKCKDFLRHKDILLSPSFLKSYNIRYVQAKQEAGEFIVLNAGAYHSGFNLGFNCAEAVNFATEEWLPLGENATRCTCSALRDAVRISMDMFKEPPKTITTRSRAAKLAADADSSADEAAGSQSSSDGEATPKIRNGKKRGVAVDSNFTPKRRRRERSVAGMVVSKVKKSRVMDTPTGGRKADAQTTLKKQSPIKSKARQTQAGARKRFRAVARDAPQDEQEEWDSTSSSEESQCSSDHDSSISNPSPSGRQVDFAKPVAVVGEDEITSKKYFYLVQRLRRQKSGRNMVAVQWLQEGKDGLFRPEMQSTWEESADALVNVRTQWVAGRTRRPGGYKLLTLRKRILDTEIV